MRLTLVISSLSSGGAERVMSIMAGYWAQQNWPVTLLTFDDGRERPFYRLDPGVVHQPLGIAGVSRSPLHGTLNNFNRVRILRRAIRKSGPDAVISFMDAVNILTLVACVGTQVPVVVSERIDPAMNPIGRAWSVLRRWVYPLASCVVVQSEAARAFFSGRIQRRTRVIPNPVMSPPSDLAPGSRQGRRQLVAMGRLHKQKGFDLLLAAFARVAPHFPDWSLTIWGEGEERAALEDLRRRLGLEDSVHLPGRTTEPFGKLRASDLFVLSSRFEGFPNVLCEAMACGLPVISFDCPSGPNRIVRNETDGLLVPAADVDALAAAMRRLMASESERSRLSCRAIEVTRRFCLESVMALWESALAQACGIPGRTRKEA
jgi:GalNAc-alpha-(1->4)-GalNAc-alpha-(1->3)-diNAcBac-PP-undecaprenol alpha-1,4-N-acetyl-D-galactosaminyltransferase